MGDHDLIGPHMFKRRGWRFWICDLCMAPWRMHPRNALVRPRPKDIHVYVVKSDPIFKEGW